MSGKLQQNGGKLQEKWRENFRDKGNKDGGKTERKNGGKIVDKKE